MARTWTPVDAAAVIRLSVSVQFQVPAWGSRAAQRKSSLIHVTPPAAIVESWDCSVASSDQTNLLDKPTWPAYGFSAGRVVVVEVVDVEVVDVEVVDVEVVDVEVVDVVEVDVVEVEVVEVEVEVVEVVVDEPPLPGLALPPLLAAAAAVNCTVWGPQPAKTARPVTMKTIARRVLRFPKPMTSPRRVDLSGHPGGRKAGLRT